jgi:hypothetical protein
MKMIFWKKQLSDKYYHLLLILLAGIFVSVFISDGRISFPVLPFIFTIGILFSLRAVEIPRHIFTFAVFFGLLALAIDILVWRNEESLSLAVKEIAILIFAAFLLFAIVLMVVKMFSAREVTSDTIAGGISVYLLLGVLWTSFYWALYVADQHAFNASVPFNHYSLLHFSFVTLTTVGYGDIQPVNKLAMALSNVEAITGQMYIAIFISRLVSLHGKAPTKSVQ